MGDGMFSHNKLACALIAALLHQTTFAQQDISQILIERGLYWQSRNDSERANEAWHKLLEVSTDNPQALYGLATTDLRADRIEAARRYLQRLKIANPDNALVMQLDQDIRLAAPQNKALLRDVSQASAASDSVTAMQKYGQIFQGQQPVGEVGRDYYTQLGYTSAGNDEAIQNLQRLQKQSPNDVKLELALARHLIRNEETRTEGIRRLASLSNNTEIGNAATESWRDALIWLGPASPSAKPLYEMYLSKNPGDTDIAQLLEKGKVLTAQASRASASERPDAFRLRTNAAMKQIGAGEIVSAQTELQAVLAKRPNDSEALGGLGVLAMREGKWQLALDFFTRARRTNEAWQSSLNLARYWVNVEQAQTAIQAGEIKQARLLASQAARLLPNEVAANVLLADILLDEGKTKQAIDAYGAVLKRQPGEPLALFGLSRAARIDGDQVQANKLLEEALLKNPDNPWVQYELALTYQHSGRTADAKRLIDTLVQKNPDAPQVQYISALLAAENQQWAQTLTSFNLIPVGLRTAPMNQLSATASRQIQITDAVNLARSGKKADAIKRLEQIATDADNDLAMTSAVARAFVDIGEPNRGLALLAPLRDQNSARGVDASIAYAGLLLAAGKDLDASLTLRQLQKTSLTASQRSRITELTDNYRVRQANQLVSEGKIASAFDMLEPVLKRQPKNLAALGALARLYAAEGKTDQARAIYEKLLASEPNNPNLHLGLALLSHQIGHDRTAMREADIAVELAPNDKQVLISAANISRNSGRTGDAVALLERALAIETPALNTALNSGNGAIDGLTNSSVKPATDATSASELTRELESLYEQRSAKFLGGILYRSRSGESGTSKLTEVQTPVAVVFPVGNGRFSLQATPVSLNAGSTNSTASFGPANILQYSPQQVDDQRQSGVGFSAGYAYKGMAFDAGVTPVGFQQVNVIGGALFNGKLDSAGSLGYRLDLSRRPVTDSLLSFAGRKYSDLGLEWGGVTATGARLTLSKDYGRGGLYGSAAWHSMNGKNVASNQRTEFNLGTYYRVIQEENTQLIAGVNLNTTFFNKNLSAFTYGSGGYFSPQAYYGLSLPVTWAQRSGPFSYRIDGALGVQQFRQSDAPVFPNNPELQALAEQASGSNNLFGNGFFPGQSKRAFSYNFRASAEYAPTPNLVLGVTLGADNAQNYQEWAGGLYLRYFFYPQRKALLDLPIEPYRSPHGPAYGR